MTSAGSEKFVDSQSVTETKLEKERTVKTGNWSILEKLYPIWLVIYSKV